MADKILISSGWFRVRPHHNLTDQSEPISYDLDPIWPAETLFNVVSPKICSLFLFRTHFPPNKLFSPVMLKHSFRLITQNRT